MKPVDPTDLRNAAFQAGMMDELIKVHGLDGALEHMTRLRDDLEIQLQSRDGDEDWRERASFVFRAASRAVRSIERRINVEKAQEAVAKRKEALNRKADNRRRTASVTALDQKWGRFAFELALELHAADPTALAALDGPIGYGEETAQLTALEWAERRLAQRQAKGEYLNTTL